MHAVNTSASDIITLENLSLHILSLELQFANSPTIIYHNFEIQFGTETIGKRSLLK